MRKLRKSEHKVDKNQVQVSAAQQAYVAAYLSRMKHVRLTQIAILVIFLGLWEVSTQFRMIDPFIFSSPSRIVECIAGMTKDGSLFYHMGITILETFISFALVITLGIAIAVLLWWNENVSKVLEPYLVILNSLPKSALAPVFIVWLGNNMKTIIVAAVSVAVFGSIITLYTDFQSVEEDKIKLIRTLGGTKKDVLFKVVIPSNIPSIISVMKVNIGLSLVGVIIGEFLAAKAGLGYLIIYGYNVKYSVF